MMATTGEWLALDPLTVIPVGLLSLGSAVGVGFLLGGLALVFERIENTFLVVQFAFVGFVAAPVGQVPALKLLPLSLDSALLRTAMGEGVGLLALPRGDLALLVAKAVVYVAAGYAALGYAGRVARRRGTLGRY
jgi:ABC-2 type transport system permease protein